MKLTKVATFTAIFPVPNEEDGDKSAEKERETATRDLDREVENFVVKCGNDFGAKPKVKISTSLCLTPKEDSILFLATVTCQQR